MDWRIRCCEERTWGSIGEKIRRGLISDHVFVYVHGRNIDAGDVDVGVDFTSIAAPEQLAQLDPDDKIGDIGNVECQARDSGTTLLT